MMAFVFPYLLDAKDIPMRRGYRQLKLSELPNSRNGNLSSFLYSKSSHSNDNFLKALDRNQTLMVETIIESLKTGRLPMANSIWKKFVKSLNNSSKSINLNNAVYWFIHRAYMRARPKLSYRAKLYRILQDKVNILEVEREEFKKVLKECERSSRCDYDTKDEIERTNDLWKRRTDIFEKEMKRSRKRFRDVYDPEDGHARLVKQMGILFIQSAQAIVSED